MIPHRARERRCRPGPVETIREMQAAERLRPVTYRSVGAMALPVIVSNVSTPLIGIVDTGVVGQIPDPAYIGAIAVGALIFSFVFWAFGFLRMATTGLTAQILGGHGYR